MKLDMFYNGYDIEDITGWQEDMNFMFEWQELLIAHS